MILRSHQVETERVLTNPSVDLEEPRSTSSVNAFRWPNYCLEAAVLVAVANHRAASFLSKDQQWLKNSQLFYR